MTPFSRKCPISRCAMLQYMWLNLHHNSRIDLSFQKSYSLCGGKLKTHDSRDSVVTLAMHLDKRTTILEKKDAMKKVSNILLLFLLVYPINYCLSTIIKRFGKWNICIFVWWCYVDDKSDWGIIKMLNWL